MENHVSTLKKLFLPQNRRELYIIMGIKKSIICPIHIYKINQEINQCRYRSHFSAIAQLLYGLQLMRLSIWRRFSEANIIFFKAMTELTSLYTHATVI